MVSLSYFISNEYLEEKYHIHTRDFIIRPQGFSIDNEASNIHGISNELAINKGEYINTVFDKIIPEFNEVDFFVGHNIEFHLNVLRSEILRNGYREFNIKNTICLMKYGVDECKLPSKKGYKYPTLNELYTKLTEKEINLSNLKNIHSLYIIEVCFSILFNKKIFKNLNLLPDPNYELLEIPFRKDNFPTIKQLVTIKNESGNFNIFYNQTLLFENINNLLIFEEWGLYYFEKKDPFNIMNVEYFIIDYRGSLVLKTINRKIFIKYCDIYNQPEIVINGRVFSNATTFINGLFLHKTENVFYEKNNNNNRAIIIFKLKKDSFTIVNNINGKIIFEKQRIIYNKNLTYFVEIKSNTAIVMDFEKKFINKIDLKERSIVNFLSYSDFIVFEKNGKKGIYDVYDNEILNSKYDSLTHLNNDIKLIKYKENENYGLINYKGECLLNLKDDFIINYFIDNDSILLKNVSTNLYGVYLIDKNILIPFEFDKIEDNKNLSKLSEDNIFETYDYFSSNVKIDYYLLHKKDKIGLYFKDYNSFIYPQFKKFEFGNKFIITHDSDENQGLYNYNGKCILECIYKNLFLYEKNDINLIEIENENKIDLLNLMNLNYEFKNINYTRKILNNNELILIINNNGFVKYKNFNTGKETDFIYTDIKDILDINKLKLEEHKKFIKTFYRFNENRIVVCRNNKYGFLDIELNEIIECKFDDANIFSNGTALVAIREIGGYFIDLFGNEIY
jgi:hypothetical protein